MTSGVPWRRIASNTPRQSQRKVKGIGETGNVGMAHALLGVGLIDRKSTATGDATRRVADTASDASVRDA